MFIITKYHLSYSDASFINSIVYMVPAVAFPVIGILVDKIGFNLIWCKSSVCMMYDLNYSWTELSMCVLT